MTAELLQPDELISGMISQVAAEPEMALLLNHFIYSTAGTHPMHLQASELVLSRGEREGRGERGGILRIPWQIWRLLVGLHSRLMASWWQPCQHSTGERHEGVCHGSTVRLTVCFMVPTAGRTSLQERNVYGLKKQYQLKHTAVFVLLVEKRQLL